MSQQRKRIPKHRPAVRRRAGKDNERLAIFGLHAVAAALANPAREILELWLTPNAARSLEPDIARRGLPYRQVTPAALLAKLGADTVHQGALVIVRPLPSPTLEALAGEAPVVVLDQVTDPHNVGAILRSAAAFGAAAVIMTRRNSPPLSGVLAKAASGALEHVPVLPVINLARTLDALREAGRDIIGLDGGAGATLEQHSFTRPSALVFGAEGRGLRRLTRSHCDHLVKITTPGPLASLNVSNAVAVVLHHHATRPGPPPQL